MQKFKHFLGGVKMGHADFASQIDTFLPKDSISELISTLRAQKQLESPPKWTRIPIIKTLESLLKRTKIPIIKPFDTISNKKQKSNLIASLRKIKYIKRKKTYNGYYCQ